MSSTLMCFLLINISGLLRFAKCEERSPPDGLRPPPTTLRHGGIHFVSSLLRILGPAKVGEEGGWLPVLLTLTGIDSEKFQDYAFDGIISVVHLITQVLAKKAKVGRRQKAWEGSSPFRFLFGLPQVVGLLTQMRDPDIVDRLLTEVEEQMKERSPEEVECVQLLLCKATPIVRGMQRSLGFFARRDRDEQRSVGRFESRAEKSSSCRRVGSKRTHCPRDRERKVMTEEEDLWEKTDVEDRIYFFAPALNEVIKFGDECDQRFPHCSY